MRAEGWWCTAEYMDSMCPVGRRGLPSHTKKMFPEPRAAGIAAACCSCALSWRSLARARAA
eukprot:scaffold2592_cov72-Phaeocystis_antarctica.AAC.6